MLITLFPVFACSQNSKDEINLENIKKAETENQVMVTQQENSTRNIDTSTVEKERGYQDSKYKEDKLDEKCYNQTNGNFLSIANCFIAAADRVNIKILAKAKKNPNKYTSQWLKEEKQKVENKCKTDYPEAAEDDPMELAELKQCIRDGYSIIEGKMN